VRFQQLTRFAAATGAAAAALAAPAATANADSRGGGAAFGVRAIGPVDVPAVPSVSSRGREANEHLAELPGNSLLKATGLKTAAGAEGSRASLSDVESPRLRLKAGAVTATCENGTGRSRLADATLAGRPLVAEARPNTTLTVPVPGLGKARVTLNKQTRDEQGRLRVTALEAAVPLGGERTQRLSLASVRCAAVPTRPQDQNSPSTGGTAAPGTGTTARPGAPAHPGTAANPGAVPQAPAPRPVAGDLPVTG